MKPISRYVVSSSLCKRRSLFTKKIMSSFLCFVCHSTVNSDTNEDTRDKYREVIGMNLCPDSHLCFICCHFLNKMWLFKSICLKRSLEYPVLFSEKGTINLQISDTQVGILCPEDICLQHLNSKYHFYNNTENAQPEFAENKYVQLHDEMHFGLLPNNVEVQTDDIFDHFNVNFQNSEADDNYNEELLGIRENNEANTRKEVDEFIFGNDSIESPLETINKIELTNLDEMSEVNITLTDLNVRSFVDKEQNMVTNNDFIDKTQVCDSNNCNVDNLQENDARNNECIDKTPELVRNNSYVENPQQFCVKNKDYIEKSEACVKYNDFVDNSQVIATYEEKQELYEDLEDVDSKNDELSYKNDLNDENHSVESHKSSTNADIIESHDSNSSQSSDNEPMTKNCNFTKITYSLKEQKMQLEENRRSKKYTEAVFKCYNCAMGFLFKDSYQAHMMRHEESNGEHQCSICTLRFANSAVLRAHSANHAIRYQCAFCSQAVKARHRQSHGALCRGERPNSVTCHLCGSTFPGSSHYQQHMKRAHQKQSSRRYLCSVCGKSYNNQAAVRTHMITHINRKFTCEVCSSVFSSPYTLNQHKKKHEPNPAELHRCVACDIGYASRKSLLAHQRNALAHKEKVYKCPVCDKTCPSLQSLQNHTMAVHARTKDLACALCPAKYSTRKGLVRHMRSHNGAVSKQVPLCHACGETFKSTSILKRHLKNVCEKDKLEEDPPSYYRH